MKRLDKVQAGCLINMVADSDGTWDVTSVWCWGSPTRTEKVFESLRLRGLVIRTGTLRDYGMYEVTSIGLDVAKEYDINGRIKPKMLPAVA
jgi:hypothetical protein